MHDTISHRHLERVDDGRNILNRSRNSIEKHEIRMRFRQRQQRRRLEEEDSSTYKNDDEQNTAATATATAAVQLSSAFTSASKGDTHHTGWLSSTFTTGEQVGMIFGGVVIALMGVYTIVMLLRVCKKKRSYRRRRRTTNSVDDERFATTAAGDGSNLITDNDDDDDDNGGYGGGGRRTIETYNSTAKIELSSTSRTRETIVDSRLDDYDDMDTDNRRRQKQQQQEISTGRLKPETNNHKFYPHQTTTTIYGVDAVPSDDCYYYEFGNNSQYTTSNNSSAYDMIKNHNTECYVVKYDKHTNNNNNDNNAISTIKKSIK